MVKSAHARKYQLLAKMMMFADRSDLPMLEGNLCLVSVLHPKLTKKGKANATVLDLDNHLKVVIDALEGILFADDKQIVEIHASYGKPVINGAVNVRVYAFRE